MVTVENTEFLDDDFKPTKKESLFGTGTIVKGGTIVET